MKKSRTIKNIQKIYIFAGCPNISVELRNKVLKEWAFLSSNYQSATNVNGKPSWKNDVAAIWTDPVNGNWNIGALKYYGGDSASLYARDEGGWITDNDNQWHYVNEEDHWTSSSDQLDIQINCIS